MADTSGHNSAKQKNVKWDYKSPNTSPMKPLTILPFIHDLFQLLSSSRFEMTCCLLHTFPLWWLLQCSNVAPRRCSNKRHHTTKRRTCSNPCSNAERQHDHKKNVHEQQSRKSNILHTEKHIENQSFAFPPSNPKNYSSIPSISNLRAILPQMKLQIGFAVKFAYYSTKKRLIQGFGPKPCPHI